MANLLDNRKEELEAFQDRLGYHFHDVRLLERAFYHRSVLNEMAEKGAESNERLEFLGDAVLELVVSEIIYRTRPKDPEGLLTKTRIQLVCESSFAFLAERFDLGRFLLLGHGEEQSGGRKKASLLSDCFEALCGAIYLDGGGSFLYSYFSENLSEIIQGEFGKERLFIDYKSRLQEALQAKNVEFSYKLVKQSGPSHQREFTVQLWIGGKKATQATASRKKQAEQEAARIAWQQGLQESL